MAGENNVRETQTNTVLRMIFQVEDGSTVQWNLTNPVTGLQRTTVDDFMNEIIEDRALLSPERSDGRQYEATNIKDAYIYQTNKIDLA